MSSPAPPDAARWGVVVPVKRLSDAKTRLTPYDEQARGELALAMAEDVVAEALRTPQVTQVVVVTADERASRALAALGALVVAEPPAGGLNPALRRGAEAVRATDPQAGVAAVAGDLPGLRADDLSVALRAVQPGDRQVLADRSGEGTTLLLAAPGTGLEPAYGPGSLAAHVASGATQVQGAAGLHADVDTGADLAVVAALGLGPRTREMWQQLSTPQEAASVRRVTVVQATVASFDAARGGQLLLDDGQRLSFDVAALAGAGLRTLRLGQRVHLRTDGERVTALTLSTLPLPD